MGMAASLRAKTGSADDAVAIVESGQRVFVHGTCATPQALIAALVRRAETLRDVRVTHLHTNGPAPYAEPGMEASFRHESLFTGSNVREAVNAGRADYIPAFLSEVPILFRDGHLPIDVAFLNVSPPDAHGYCSLGTSVDCALSAARHARAIVAQINHAMPRTLGDSFIHIDQIDRAVEVDQPPAEVPAAPPSEVELRIGGFVASLIEDGSTLQMGIGSIPNAVLTSLGSHRDLGVHSEMFSDGVVELVERGVITGARNPLHPGKLLSSFVMGSATLYAFVDDNPQVALHPVDYVNDTSVIRRNHRMVAINSALEIDLTGQVCAASIGDRVYSGIGGQVDFMRGAALAPGGKPILALPSTAAGGTQSRIVGHLRPGAMLTLVQGNVHYVVTEYGIADLYGKSLRQRAEALIAIAHPSFRDDLAAFARDLHRL
ncbi:MAG TPA: acetyl-CoA hydrolase/transferase C-terminal domain-containing protein [Thermomicrobiales bacterium]|nr:acetyl-CoA hydrolase/transferase C-terminal domain-containing protein [Thermomicrobiales bacterium]